MIDLCHQHHLPVITTGAATSMPSSRTIEMGLEALNPLEAKADLDVSDTGPVATATPWGSAATAVRRLGSVATQPKSVAKCCIGCRRHRAQAAYDLPVRSLCHHVPRGAYDLIVKLVREFGNYPLNLPAE